MPARPTNNFDNTKIYEFPLKVNRVILPLDYSYACTGDLLVTAGQVVKQNQALTQNIYNNHMSIAIHSPIDGVVSNIGEYPILQPINQNSNIKTIKSIEITANNLSDNREAINISLTNNHKPSNIENFINMLSSNGIIGLGGAGFPSAQKLSSQNIDTIIINAVECEPPISVDNSLIINKSKEIVAGIILLKKIFHAKKVILAIKKTMIEAIETLKPTIDDSNLILYSVPDQYPNGYSKTLINLVTNKNIPNNKHSSDYGIICINVATVYAIEQAFNKQKPLTERIVTITGNIEKPGNYIIPIGTPISTILQAFMRNYQLNNQNKKNLVIKIGGDYMGYEICNLEQQNLENIAIDKTTQALAIYYKNPSQKTLDYEKNSNTIKIKLYKKLYQWWGNINNEPKQKACIKCNLCETVCPVNLKPQQLYWFSHNIDQNNNNDIINSYNIAQCIECGLCDNICLSNIPLTAKFRYAKSKLKILTKEQNDAKLAEARNKLHNAKIELKQKYKEQLLASKNKSKKELLATVLNRAKKKHES